MGIAPLASNENALSVNNNNPANQIFLLKAGGDLYIDGGLAVGGGTDLLSNYTEFADLSIVLADAATGGNVATFTKVSARATRIGREVTVYLNWNDSREYLIYSRYAVCCGDNHIWGVWLL